MKNQVLSIKQCKELISLGIDMSNASMLWVKKSFNNVYHIEVNEGTFLNEHCIPTYTLQDILSRLKMGHVLRPNSIIILKDDIFIEGESALDAAFATYKLCKKK